MSLGLVANITGVISFFAGLGVSAVVYILGRSFRLSSQYADLKRRIDTAEYDFDILCNQRSSLQGLSDARFMCETEVKLEGIRVRMRAFDMEIHRPNTTVEKLVAFVRLTGELKHARDEVDKLQKSILNQLRLMAILPLHGGVLRADLRYNMRGGLLPF